MVAEAPVWGSGAGSFRAGYMTRQADFFKTNPESKYALVAGNVFHPLNEYLLLLIEFGIVGLLLSGAVLVPIARASGQSDPFRQDRLQYALVITSAGLTPNPLDRSSPVTPIYNQMDRYY